MPRSASEDPIKAFRYTIDIDGIPRAGFSECSGLSETTAIIEYREGGDAETPQKSPGLKTYSDITLTRGQTVLTETEWDLIDWGLTQHQLGLLGHPGEYRKDMTITQYDNFGQPARHWDVTNCLISVQKPMSDLGGLSNTNHVETLTLAHEGYRLRERLVPA